MPSYLAICWDGDRIADGFDFEADDDREALALLALRKRSDCELWEVGRLVARVPKGATPLGVVPGPPDDAEPASPASPADGEG